MIKIANNLKHLAFASTKNANVQDFLASLTPIATGLGAGYAGHSLSRGSIPVALASSLLGSLAGVPLMYLLSTEAVKKKYRKNPMEAFGSFGLVI